MNVYPFFQHYVMYNIKCTILKNRVKSKNETQIQTNAVSNKCAHNT